MSKSMVGRVGAGQRQEVCQEFQGEGLGDPGTGALSGGGAALRVAASSWFDELQQHLLTLCPWASPVAEQLQKPFRGFATEPLNLGVLAQHTNIPSLIKVGISLQSTEQELGIDPLIPGLPKGTAVGAEVPDQFASKWSCFDWPAMPR